MADEQGSVGHYTIVDVLGRGGFATVYLVHDPSLDRDVALKLLHRHLADDDAVRRRFLSEVRAIARLKHPNVVTVYETGEVDGQPYYTMEYVDGRTLADLLTPERQLALQEVVDLFRPLCDAVNYLHQMGIVHRDIKPANVMRSRTGRVLLMDFGIARVLEQVQLTQSGATVGTPAYMAPEQALGEQVTPACDIYALGILAYQMLAGRPPFRGATAQVLHSQAYDPPPDLRGFRSDLPDNVYTAVVRALAKDPSERPSSSTALADLLFAGTPPSAPVQPTEAVTAVQAAEKAISEPDPTAVSEAGFTPVPVKSAAPAPEAAAEPVGAATDEPPSPAVQQPATAQAPRTGGRRGLRARRGVLRVAAVAVAVLLAVGAGVVIFAQRTSGGHTAANDQTAPAVNPAQPGTIQLVLNDYAFSTTAITASVGTPVTLVIANHGAHDHNWHLLNAHDATGNEIKTPIYRPGTGASFAITLNAPGTWHFQCDVFPTRMQGTLTAQ